MARAHSSDGGGTGLVVATVLLGIGFVACLVWAIVATTQVAGENQELDEAEDQLKRFATKTERNSDTVKALIERAGRKQSAVGLLMEEHKKLLGLVKGADSTWEAVKFESERLEVGEGSTLLGQIDILRQNLDYREAERAATRTERDRAVKSLVEVEDRKRQADDSYRRSVEQFKSQLAALQSDFEAYQHEKNELIGQLQHHLDSTRAELSTQLRQTEQSIEDMEYANEQLAARVKELLDTRGQGGTADLIEADGQVVTTDTGATLAYINLGRTDRVLRGLTFEVFERDTTIKLDSIEGNLRGKATVEVVRVGDGSSTARIVRRDPGAMVDAGDQIVNIAYDPTATYEFFVHGKFDIDNRGMATLSDNKRIQAMIERWGGVITDDLNYQTDFLVVGVRPVQPSTPQPDASIGEIERYRDLLTIYEQYEQLVDRASRLKIPILNQNRFLKLYGDYDR